MSSCVILNKRHKCLIHRPNRKGMRSRSGYKCKRKGWIISDMLPYKFRPMWCPIKTEADV